MQENGGIKTFGRHILSNIVMQNDGCTALHEAASIGDEKTLIILLNRGVDRNAKETKYGNTALHEAAWRGFSRSVKLLCSLPPILVDNSTSSKFKLSTKLQNTENVLHSTLLGVRNAGGFSALHLAAQNGHNQTCREILLAGADADVQNNYGDTPLHTACRYGHAGATRILISAKSDLNRTNLNGDTSLHIACAMGRRKLTKILLMSGAIINIKNLQNETPKDIAIRKKLTGILDLIITPVHIDNNKESANTYNNNKMNISQKDKSKSIDNPMKWSPYGCHYFPDPKTFPSPRIETLPKEPLNKGEQYFVDLAGNIRKGPVGVGNTCYCGPFFRHIEEKISKNRKSITQYVHKATQRLDNKVQALALKTDDQIEQLTRSMLIDRIRCEGRRLHLQDWLKRGELLRVTTGGYCHIKSKKNYDNINTLRKSKSLEILGAKSSADDMTTQMQNAKSFSILDNTKKINFENKSPHSFFKLAKTDIGNMEINVKGKNFKLTDNLPVATRLEELLTKTNQIFEMEKITKLSRGKVGELVDLNKLRTPSKNLVEKCMFQVADDKTLMKKFKRKPLLHNNIKPDESNAIEEQMKKITESLTGVQIKEYSRNQIDSYKSTNANNLTSDQLFTYKKNDQKIDEEQEKCSILDTKQNLFANGFTESFKRDNEGNNFEDTFSNLITALRKDFVTTKKVIVSSAAQYFQPNNEGQNNHVDQTDSDASDYCEENTQVPSSYINESFFQNNCFDDTKSSSNNTTLKSVCQTEKSNISGNTAKQIIENINNPKESNEIKSFMLNQPIRRGQILRKNQQIGNDQQVDQTEPMLEKQLTHSKIYGGVNSIVQKFQIKNSEIKPLKQPYPIVNEVKQKSTSDHTFPNAMHNHSRQESDDRTKFSVETNNIHNYYCNDYSQLEPNQMLLMTTKNNIPKDAYFHEISKKYKLQTNLDELNEKHSTPSHLSRRTRLTLHYDQNFYQNKAEKFKIYNQGNYERTPPTHPLRISLTPEIIQFDRDLSNDSGFSTKMGGSSHGPSPSLFCNSECTSNDAVNSKLLYRPKFEENNNDENSVLQFFVDNASSLV